ncbi:DUF292-domain-containing protein [Suhomyces tanzawaensis NRRL Y-17324]|uniref:DUF292-domain-containing protein n=1 Tax=Suhomyces tanzawaensis NRRL Y-17324 TaxID=984487 RepID=A0A1E4SPQ8_9ASCO|nr:DUF292-domain-containing protein [Suhomyces tanzawaensis NRRL Y-17324]ODV81493.1 DUF292-domain-containing protein [Suhomyces tanzawaensis NRRL Y-17324]
MPQPVPHLALARLKTSLKMAISKLKFIQEKKTALTKQQRRQLAELLKQGKESSAKIRVENIIRDDIYIELLEYLELYCELLLARITIILDPARTTCENNILEGVLSVIYGASHSELKELITIRDILIHKYGPDFGKRALENSDGHVPEKIVKRCQVDPPEETLVNLYLCEIARAYEAPYSGLKIEEIEEAKKDTGDEDDDDEPSGGVKEPEAPIAETAKPLSPAAKELSEFDALKARFAALKGK